MRCKKGDLAIVVKSRNPNSPNIGKIVRCIRYCSEEERTEANIYDDKVRWIVDTNIQFYCTATGVPTITRPICSDNNLIPLNHKLEDISEEQIKEIVNE